MANEQKQFCQVIICTDPGVCVNQPPADCVVAVPALGWFALVVMACAVAVAARKWMIQR